MVACSQKSGSTYAARVIQEYLDASIANINITGYYWPQEQNLSSDLLAQLISERYVLQMHLRPYPPNLAAMRARRMKVVVLWRNLADSIVSLDEHIRNESELVPWCYIFSREHYAALGLERRYKYLIENAIPYFFAFYLSWRREDAKIYHYENMVRDQHGFFSDLIASFAPIDDDRLRRCLRTRFEQTRFNIGVVGRSLQTFSPEMRAFLEEKIRQHCECEQLDILIDDLPWNSRACKLVRAVGYDEIFLLRGNRRHWVTCRSWIQSRPLAESRLIHDVASEQLDVLLRGGPIY